MPGRLLPGPARCSTAWRSWRPRGRGPRSWPARQRDGFPADEAHWALPFPGRPIGRTRAFEAWNRGSKPRPGAVLAEALHRRLVADEPVVLLRTIPAAPDRLALRIALRPGRSGAVRPSC